MERNRVTLMCYWNGRIRNGPHGISYEGAFPKPIGVDNKISYTELIHRLHEITGFNKQQFQLKIICRYPASREYIAVPIDNDDSLDIIFDVARKPDTNCLEIYVEKVQHNVDQVNVHASTPVSIHGKQTSIQYGYNKKNMSQRPTISSQLTLQKQHRSQQLFSGQDPGVLKSRQQLGSTMKGWKIDPRLMKYVIQSGFYGVYRIGFLPLDFPLITALVERWHQETHTFHLVVGEATVTLEDVALLLGLPIDGVVVSGSCSYKWDDLCEDLLGLKPNQGVLKGSVLKMSWLKSNFSQPPQGADEVTLQRYARAYILALMCSYLFTDKSGCNVQLIFLPLLRNFELAGKYSWGSAVLAYLYRELCKASRNSTVEIGGPLALLQLWAWEHLHLGHPKQLNVKAQNKDVGDTLTRDEVIQSQQFPNDPLGCRWRLPYIDRSCPQKTLELYRKQLNEQREDQMKWQPYNAQLRNISQPMWRTIAPLICFGTVEWHQPDRVLRQFGLRQEIPQHCDTELALHAITRKKKHDVNWLDYHKRYITMWESRLQTIAKGTPLEQQPQHDLDGYMTWYRNFTNPKIIPQEGRAITGLQPNSKVMPLKQVRDFQVRYAQSCETIGEGQQHEEPLLKVTRDMADERDGGINVSASLVYSRTSMVEESIVPPIVAPIVPPPPGFEGFEVNKRKRLSFESGSSPSSGYSKKR